MQSFLPRTTGRGVVALDFRRYRLVVFDLDGTLYHQAPVRLTMLVELLRTSTSADGPGRAARLSVLRHFRQLRESLARTGTADFDASLFSRLSAEMNRDEASLRALVREWIEVRPLRHLRAARLAGAPELFAALRKRGIQTAVWSDYPVREKLDVLDLEADHTFCALDPGIAALKPNPAGLLRLLERTRLPPEAVLMIGDRDSHDGAAARACGIDFLLRASRGPPGMPRIRDFHGLAAQLSRHAP